jgi:hypothetical protein
VSRTRESLLTWLDALGFVREVPFKGISGKRRFRFDAALTDGRMVAVDYQGIGAGHQWHKEQASDHEKINEAQLLGWIFVLCDAQSVNSGRCLEYVERALQGQDDDHRGMA